MRIIPIVLTASLTACAAFGIDPAEFEPLPRPIASDTMTRLATGTWVSPEGTRIRFAMVVPPMVPGDRLPLVVALHGQAPTRDTVPPYYGQRSLEALFGPALRPLGALIIAPDAPRNNWTDPASERALLGLVAEVKRRYPIDTLGTLLTGISMGGMGSWFIAQRHPSSFRAFLMLTSFPLIGHTQFNSTGLGAAYTEMIRDNGAAWTPALRAVPIYAIHSRQDERVPFAAESTLVSMINAGGGSVHFVAVDSLRHGPASAYQGVLRSSLYWIRRQWERPPNAPAVVAPR